MSYLEIYNEKVADLLGKDQDLMVLENGKGEVVVNGLTSIPVSSIDQVINNVSFGNRHRKMAKTSCNQFSSRSHAIVQIFMERDTPQGLLRSKLSFVDLAGSERVDMTENKGERLNEGSNINKSLLTLGTVIRKLSKKNPDRFVPFRDSKLTRLLKDSLGGSSKTVLIVCITPKNIHFEETLHSLNYGSHAKNIKNNVRRNYVVDEV